MSAAPATDPTVALSAEEIRWTVLAHAVVPFSGVLGPGLVYLLTRDRGARTRASAAEAVNWAVVYTTGSLGCLVLLTVVIGQVVWPLLLVAAVVYAVLGALAARRGEVFRYPLVWPLVGSRH